MPLKSQYHRIYLPRNESLPFVQYSKNDLTPVRRTKSTGDQITPNSSCVVLISNGKCNSLQDTMTVEKVLMAYIVDTLIDCFKYQHFTNYENSQFLQHNKPYIQTIDTEVKPSTNLLSTTQIKSNINQKINKYNPLIYKNSLKKDYDFRRKEYSSQITTYCNKKAYTNVLQTYHTKNHSSNTCNNVESTISCNHKLKDKFPKPIASSSSSSSQPHTEVILITVFISVNIEILSLDQ
ncbi:unnamed protein product [Heterobilharzia americana]|nr:unnamed protein product [Heterobilharzia americana]